MAAALDLGEFPVASSRVPDAETQARSFLTKHPDKDGRGVVVAIMDTGTDPGAPGMQVTSHGLPKVIDCIDCTGSGDVDTSTIVEVADGCITNPHTGRKLKLGSGSNWTNPSGKWHVGVKKAYELFDEELISRVKKDRAAAWEAVHGAYAVEARQKLSAFEAANPKPEGDALHTKKDLEERVSQLSALQKEDEDHGMILDVVAWHDGALWRAAVGGREDGDLSGSPALASFKAERQFASFGDLEQMNYSLNIFDDGMLVSIVCDTSSHGTHCAGIAAACHPEEPERNGVAPGAQIVSIKIADTRLDSMETGMGMARAFSYCSQNNIDIINMSFGEGASPAQSGRIIELAKKTVERHGVIFVTSAGNEGPALSTIGSPGNGSETFITVGAHVSPPAMETQYSMVEKVPATPYTWTSRGPTQTGSLGVTICAPGSAITSIPNWTLSGAQLMNGTSMAAPNCAGCLALVLSGLKATSVSYSPASIQRAAKATALALPGADPFAIGAGMVQVEDCYEYSVKHHEIPYRDVTISAKVIGRGAGISLREPNETDVIKAFTVSVHPDFRELDPSLNKSKINLELNIAITSTVPWITVPKFAVLPAGGCSFAVRVDPTGLKQGEAHLGHVCGYDTTRPEVGTLFRVPVSVVRPLWPKCCSALQEAPLVHKTGINFSQGHIERTFIAVPSGCTWAEFTVRTKPFDGGARVFFFHALQDLPHLPHSKTCQQARFMFRNAGEKKETMRVEPLGTIEVALAQFWSSLGSTEVDIEVKFYGIVPQTTHIALSAGEPVATVYALSGPGVVTLKPSATLSIHRSSARPSSAVISAGGERDIYPDGKRVHELVNEYPLKLEEDAEVTPQALLLNDKLYESAYEAQMILIFDSNKRFVAATDAWPTPKKLKKGEYVFRLQVRHDDVSLLEKLKTMPLCFDKKMDKEIKVKAYSSLADAVTGKSEFDVQQVKGHTRSAIFFAVPVDEKIPDAFKHGDVLLGAASFGEPSAGNNSKKTRGGLTVQYVLDAPKATEKKEDEKDDDPRTNAEKLAHSIRDAQIKHLESIRKWDVREEHTALLALLLKMEPKHLPLHSERILFVEEVTNPDSKIAADEKNAQLSRVAEAADTLLSVVNLDELAGQLGRRVDPDDKEATRARKEVEKTKDAVIQALTKKFTALAELAIKDGSQEAKDKAVAAHKALSAWIDVGEAKHARITCTYEQVSGRLGLALAAWNKHLGEEKGAPKREALEERAKLLEKLGWTAWAERERLGFLVRFPKAYSRF